MIACMAIRACLFPIILADKASSKLYWWKANRESDKRIKEFRESMRELYESIYRLENDQLKLDEVNIKSIPEKSEIIEDLEYTIIQDWEPVNAERKST